MPFPFNVFNLPVTRDVIVGAKAYQGGSFAATTGGGSEQSDGIVLGTTYRLQHYITASAITPRVLFGNSEQDRDGTNSIIVKAALETSSGAIVPLTFSGSSTVTIAPGTFVYADPAAMTLAKGDYVWSRTYVSVANTGEKWWKGFVHQETGEGETNSDMAYSGTVPTNTGYSYCPFAIHALASGTNNQIAIFGDSLASGFCSPPFDKPFAVTALGSNFGQDYPHILVAENSEGIANFVAFHPLRGQLVVGSTHALIVYAFVHVATSTFATAQADLQALWSCLQGLGITKLWQCTFPPVTDSTDGWATLGNQTPSPLWNNPVRLLINDWIRTTPTPLAGFFELAGSLESSLNSGLWKVPGYTTDGLHTNTTTSNTAAQNSINPALF